MVILTWTNFIALLTFILLCRTWKDKKGRGLSVFIGFLVLLFTVIKGCQDGRATKLMAGKTDSIRWLIDTVATRSKSIDTLNIKIDTLTSYVKKVEAAGLRRDSVHNIPIPVSQTFDTRINSVKAHDFTIGIKH